MEGAAIQLGPDKGQGSHAGPCGKSYTGEHISHSSCINKHKIIKW